VLTYKKQKLDGRQKRKRRVRTKVRGTPDRPRLCVFRSARHIYVQAIDDETGKTITQASTLDKEYVRPDGKGKINSAKNVGLLIAKKLLAKNYKLVTFDRNGYLYHGRVKALADGAREGGLQF